MKTYRVTLANKGGHTRRETITAASQVQAERIAETKRPGYGVTDTKEITA